MNNNRFLLAVLAGSIIAFFGGWLIFGILFGNYYSSNTNDVARVLMKEEPQVWAIALSNIAWAFLLVFVLQRTHSNTFARGFVTSLWVSALIAGIFDLSMYAFWNIYELRFII